MSKTNVFIITIVFILAICVNTCVFMNTNRKQAPEVRTEIVHHTDTVWKTVEKTVFIDHPTVSTVDTAGNKIYKDTLRNQYVDIYTESSIQGVFNWQKLEYKLKFPEITHTNTVTIEKTLPAVERYALYGLGSLSIYPENRVNVNFGLAITKGRLLVGYQYGLSQKSHQITLGYKF